MAAEDYNRKLTAILSADVVGYSRLMGDDESATVSTLKSHRRLISENVLAHQGRVIDSPGDNILAEFGSIVDAVSCAVDIQKGLMKKNEVLPDSRKMVFRIGLNLGDVIEDGERIYGDGVNIAARIESLAKPGEVAISGTVFDNIRNKLKFGYEFVGEHQVKNIAQPVRVYHVLTDPASSGKIIGEPEGDRSTMPKTILAVAVVILLVAATYLYIAYNPSMDISNTEVNKPSIAVLPFDNLSNDPEQEYFSDGISEEIITALSKTPKMFVIARNSSFSYKGRPVNVQEVGKELGVRYMVEGSVRKAGEQVRITAQLVDVKTGHQLWAEKYDHELKDIFSLQDQIAKRIITELQVELTEGEQARIYDKGTKNFEVYLKVLEARSLIRNNNIEDNHKARQILKDCISVEPNYAPAYRWLGAAHFSGAVLGAAASKKEAFDNTFKYAQKAVSIDDSYGDAYGLLGFSYVLKRKYENSIPILEKALKLDPNGADTNFYLAMSLLYLDDLEKALSFQKKAIRLNPIAPSIYLNIMAAIHRSKGDYEEALVWSEKAVKQNPNHIISRVNHCSILVLAGKKEEALVHADKVKELNPKFSVKKLERSLPYKNPGVKKTYIDALRKSGLPE